MKNSENPELFRELGVDFSAHAQPCNIQHILPKLDELRILMANDKCADILGLCESFLDPNIMDQQVAIEGYDFIRKDRMVTQK